MKMSWIVSALFLLLVVVGVALSGLMFYSPNLFVGGGGERTPVVHLKTGGTSVALLILENRWRGAYRKAKGVDLDYESTGSTKGLNEMIDHQLEVAFTHAPMSEEQRKAAKEKGGEVVHIPMILCAVVPVYNVPGVKSDAPLKFTGEVLADIFLGKIDHWNDPALKKLNDGVDLPDAKIAVVHRQDSSGTTFIFTDYLSSTSEAWRQKVGKAGSEVAWPVGEGRERNQGVAMAVRETEGAIGYVDLVHAWNYSLPYGKVRNKEGEFILPEAKNLTAAAKSIVGDLPEDLTFELTDRPGKDSYPITGTIWAVCYQTQPAAERDDVVNFLHWAAHDGQQFAENVSYAPVPPEFVERVDKKLDAMTAAR